MKRHSIPSGYLRKILLSLTIFITLFLFIAAETYAMHRFGGRGGRGGADLTRKTLKTAPAGRGAGGHAAANTGAVVGSGSPKMSRKQFKQEFEAGKNRLDQARVAADRSDAQLLKQMKEHPSNLQRRYREQASKADAAVKGYLRRHMVPAKGSGGRSALPKRGSSVLSAPPASGSAIGNSPRKLRRSSSGRSSNRGSGVSSGSSSSGSEAASAANSRVSVPHARGTERAAPSARVLGDGGHIVSSPPRGGRHASPQQQFRQQPPPQHATQVQDRVQQFQHRGVADRAQPSVMRQQQGGAATQSPRARSSNSGGGGDGAVSSGSNSSGSGAASAARTRVNVPHHRGAERAAPSVRGPNDRGLVSSSPAQTRRGPQGQQLRSQAPPPHAVQRGPQGQQLRPQQQTQQMVRGTPESTRLFFADSSQQKFMLDFGGNPMPVTRQEANLWSALKKEKGRTPSFAEFDQARQSLPKTAHVSPQARAYRDLFKGELRRDPTPAELAEYMRIHQAGGSNLEVNLRNFFRGLQ